MTDQARKALQEQNETLSAQIAQNLQLQQEAKDLKDMDRLARLKAQAAVLTTMHTAVKEMMFKTKGV